MSFGKIIDKKSNDLSKRINLEKVPEHVAIIMDGNGRWATKKGLPRSFGHNKGCLLYTSPSPRDGLLSRMPSSA